MGKQFEHYHLSLIEKVQGELYVDMRSRDEWLQHTFGQRFTFTHHGNEFHWVPHADASPMILGTVERQKQRVQHRAPEEGAAEFLAEEWQGSLVVIDPVYQVDGQKLAFEVDLGVGRTNAILDSMVAHLNSQPSQYTVFVKPLFDGESFWKFARRHGGVVQYVTFSFVVPNMFFGTTTSVNTGLKRIGQDTGAQEVKVTLDSDIGVSTDSQSVRDAMAYAEAGNGTVTAKALNGDRYSSTRKQKSSRIDGLLSSGKESVQDWISKVLGRGQDDSMDEPDSSDGGTPLS